MMWSFMQNNDDKMKAWGKRNKEIFVTVFFASFTCFFYAPLESYLQNTSEFWFNLREIWYIPTIIGLLAFALFSIPGTLLKSDKLKKIYAVLAFSGGLCAWLQGNFFNTKLGLMNGAFIDWHAYREQFNYNLIGWLVTIVLITAIGIWKTDITVKTCRYIALLLTAMQLVALLSLLPNSFSNGAFAKQSKRFMTSDHLWEIGDAENLIVIVLDAYDQNYFMNLVRDNCEELNELDGFTWFSNFSGMYSTTEYGTIPLLTGKKFLNEVDFEDNLKKNGTYYDDLIEQGYDFAVYSDRGYNVPDYIQDKMENRIVYVDLDMNGVRGKATELIYRLAWCKYLPDHFKSKLWLYGPELYGFDHYSSDDELFVPDNSVFRDGLAQKKLTVVGGKKFRFIHVNGAHEPFTIGDDLEDVPDYWDCDLIAERALKLATRYIGELKRVAQYDNSTVIITSDHGSQHVPGIVGNPVLLVKPRNSHGKLKENKAPVSQGDFGATIVNLIHGKTVYEDETSAFMIDEDAERDRRFYAYLYTEDGKIVINKNRYVLVEYTVDSKDCSTPLFNLTDKGYLGDGNEYKHSDYCETCQQKVEPVIENNWLYWKHVGAGELP